MTQEDNASIEAKANEWEETDKQNQDEKLQALEDEIIQNKIQSRQEALGDLESQVLLKQDSRFREKGSSLEVLESQILNKQMVASQVDETILDEQQQQVAENEGAHLEEPSQLLETNHDFEEQELSDTNNHSQERTSTNYTSIVSAEVVDEADVENRRSEIARMTEQQILSNATVATVVDKEPGTKHRRLWWFVATAVLVMVIFGWVCGSGKCKSSSSTIAAEVRMSAIVALINAESLSVRETGLIIDYPGNGTTPEEMALEFLIVNDPVQLSVLSDGDPEANWRLLQRFALLVVLFTNGPFTYEEDNTKYMRNETTFSAANEWLVKPDECSWFGVVCNDSGRVVRLDKYQRGMTGTIPRDVALLTGLTVLDFAWNALNGTMSDVLSIMSNLENLESLDLYSNDFEGTLPESLSQFTALTALNLAGNGLTGSIPESISSMTQLEVLELCSQDGTVSENPRFRGTFPTWMGSLTSLKALRLDFCGFFEPINYEIFETMGELERLGIGEASSKYAEQVLSFTGLSGLSKLTSLIMANASVVAEGSFPAEVGKWWPDMEELILGGGDLAGSFPTSVALWTNLRELLLPGKRGRGNGITGMFPDAAFAGWSNLEVLFLRDNSMSGPLPSEIALWSNLRLLSLTRNNFSSTLPTTVGLLTSLDVLHVNGNDFSGIIPREVVNIKATVEYYHGNNFSGDAPWCLSNDTNVRDAPGRIDCDKVNCPCCRYC